MALANLVILLFWRMNGGFIIFFEPSDWKKKEIRTHNP